MGVGKTTRAKLLEKHLGLTPVYEKYGDNPYLEKFYQDKQKWAFKSQQWFLEQKLAQLADIQTMLESDSHSGIIQDMAIYQDAAFAHNLYSQHYIDKQSWEKYEQLLENKVKKLPKPVIFYLTAEIPSVLNRVHHRGRDFEKNVDEVYLQGLQESIKYWLKKISAKVIVVEFGTEKMDLENNLEQQERFITFAKHYLGIK